MDPLVLRMRPEWLSRCEDDSHIDLGGIDITQSKDRVCKALSDDYIEWFNDRPDCNNDMTISGDDIVDIPGGELVKVGENCLTLEEISRLDEDPYTRQPFSQEVEDEHRRKSELKRYHAKTAEDVIAIPTYEQDMSLRGNEEMRERRDREARIVEREMEEGMPDYEDLVREFLAGSYAEAEQLDELGVINIYDREVFLRLVEQGHLENIVNIYRARRVLDLATVERIISGVEQLESQTIDGIDSVQVVQHVGLSEEVDQLYSTDIQNTLNFYRSMAGDPVDTLVRGEIPSVRAKVEVFNDVTMFFENGHLKITGPKNFTRSVFQNCYVDVEIDEEVDVTVDSSVFDNSRLVSEYETGLSFTSTSLIAAIISGFSVSSFNMCFLRNTSIENSSNVSITNCVALGLFIDDLEDAVLSGSSFGDLTMDGEYAPIIRSCEIYNSDIPICEMEETDIIDSDVFFINSNQKVDIDDCKFEGGKITFLPKPDPIIIHQSSFEAYELTGDMINVNFGYCKFEECVVEPNMNVRFDNCEFVGCRFMDIGSASTITFKNCTFIDTITDPEFNVTNVGQHRALPAPRVRFVPRWTPEEVLSIPYASDIDSGGEHGSEFGEEYESDFIDDGDSDGFPPSPVDSDGFPPSPVGSDGFSPPLRRRLFIESDSDSESD